MLPGPGTADTYGYVGVSETVARIASVTGGVTTITDSIVSATGDRIGVKVGSTVNWLLPDLHGNTGASLSADEAAVTNAIRYDAYGMTLATGRPGTSPAPVGDKAWKYQGRLDISPEGLATPLYDMGARFYAPSLGAFTQMDTVAGSAQDPLSMNRFLYAQANPATLIDPDGHTACSAYADYCTTNGSATKRVIQKHDKSGHRTANRGRRTSVMVANTAIGRAVRKARSMRAVGETGPFARSKSFKKEADDRDTFNGIVQAGLAAASATANAEHVFLDDNAAKLDELAVAKYEAAMDVVEGLYQRHRTGNLVEEAVQWVGDHSAALAIKAAARVEGSLIRGLAKGARGLARWMVPLSIGLDFTSGALSQADDDRRKGLDPITSLGRNAIRGGLGAAGGFGGSVLGAFGGAAAGTEIPFVGNVAGAAIGAAAGGFGGQQVGDFGGTTIIDWMDHPDHAPWNQ